MDNQGADFGAPDNHEIEKTSRIEHPRRILQYDCAGETARGTLKEIGGLVTDSMPSVGGGNR